MAQAAASRAFWGPDRRHPQPLFRLRCAKCGKHQSRGSALRGSAGRPPQHRPGLCSICATASSGIGGSSGLFYRPPEPPSTVPAAIPWPAGTPLPAGVANFSTCHGCGSAISANVTRWSGFCWQCRRQFTSTNKAAPSSGAA